MFFCAGGVFGALSRDAQRGKGAVVSAVRPPVADPSEAPMNRWSPYFLSIVSQTLMSAGAREGSGQFNEKCNLRNQPYPGWLLRPYQIQNRPPMTKYLNITRTSCEIFDPASSMGVKTYQLMVSLLA